MMHYESAQAQMEEQMRKAAIWRMQRVAIEARKQARKHARKSARTTSWLDAISKALGGNAGRSADGVGDSFSDN